MGDQEKEEKHRVVCGENKTGEYKRKGGKDWTPGSPSGNKENIGGGLVNQQMNSVTIPHKRAG